MGFIIKVTHRSPAASPREIYYGAVPIDRIPIENREPDTDFQMHMFKSFEEAAECPFPSTEVASSMALQLGDTKNLDYQVVEVQNEPEGFDDSEADAVPLDIVQELEDINKAKAYTEFFEYCCERLISLGAETIGDLPAEEQQIIAEKQSALVEKYGATKYGPLDVQ